MKRLNWNLRTTLSEKPIPFFSDDLSAYVIAYHDDKYYIYSTYHNSYLFDPKQIHNSDKPECFKKYALKSIKDNLKLAKRCVRTLENNKDK